MLLQFLNGDRPGIVAARVRSGGRFGWPARGRVAPPAAPRKDDQGSQNQGGKESPANETPYVGRKSAIHPGGST